MGLALTLEILDAQRQRLLKLMGNEGEDSLLDRKATKGKPAIYNRPYWHRFGEENFEGGGYGSR